MCIWRLDGKEFRTKRKSTAMVRTPSKNTILRCDMQHGALAIGDTLGDSKGKYYGGRTLTGHKALPVLEIHGRTPSLVRSIRVVVHGNRSSGYGD